MRVVRGRNKSENIVSIASGLVESTKSPGRNMVLPFRWAKAITAGDDAWMVELVDTQDLGSCEIHFMRVQVPLQAPIVMIFNIHNEYSYGMLLLSLIRLIRGIHPHHNT